MEYCLFFLPICYSENYLNIKDAILNETKKIPAKAPSLRHRCCPYLTTHNSIDMYHLI